MAQTKAKKAKSSPTRDNDARWLRDPSESRTERRFSPKSSAGALASVLAWSLGAVGLGAAAFNYLLRSGGPATFAPFVAVGGLALAVAGIVLGGRTPKVVRVGDAGVATEKDGDAIERLAWCDVDSVRLSSGMLAFMGGGKLVSIDCVAHADAASMALSEARSRIPAKVADITEKLPSGGAGAGEKVKLEAAQIAGARCGSSGRIISFEKDGRLCGRCGQVYHREEVPKRCVSCDARLA
jgi:ribosomal protein S27AE